MQKCFLIYPASYSLCYNENLFTISKTIRLLLNTVTERSNTYVLICWQLFEGNYPRLMKESISKQIHVTSSILRHKRVKNRTFRPKVLGSLERVLGVSKESKLLFPFKPLLQGSRGPPKALQTLTGVHGNFLDL
jgi:hypothetical protein